MSGTNSLGIEMVKKKIRKIDWEIVGKIMMCLHGGKMKKTNLAMECRLSFDKCLLYLDWLQIMNLIKVESDKKGSDLFSLTEHGMNVCRREFVSKGH